MGIRTTALFLGGLIASTAQAAPQYYSEPGRAVPLSAAVRAGDMVFASGQIGVDATGTLPPDFGAQTRNAMQHIADALALAGAGMGDVVKCDVAMSDLKNWPAFNAVYQTFFKPGAYPVRMVTGVAGLVKGAGVEVQCQAWRPVAH